jgi:prolyl-tRNA synthetase
MEQTTKTTKSKEDIAAARKQTLGIGADKSSDFATWYNQLVTQTELIEFYEVSGCYVLRPRSYFIWEQLKEKIDSTIKKMGVKNVYFPLFVTENSIKKEESHIDGFAAELAWITHCGDSALGTDPRLYWRFYCIQVAADDHRLLPGCNRISNTI